MDRLTRLTPMLQTMDLRKTIDFYSQTLGFTVAAVWPDEKPVWCQLERDGARIMFMMNDHLASPQLTGTLYIQTTDVLEMHRRIVDKVIILWGPEVYDYGMHEFAIKDNNGYTVSFGQPVESQDLGRDEQASGDS
jgi:uncharacterized glyoxalase superfamily protein PhnB